MTDFNWLHLTDFHFGMAGIRDFWPGIRQEFVRDLESLISKNDLPLDLVLFTGDLVQRGSADEYEAVDEVLEWLWSRFGEMGCQPKLLAIPGNHDLTRPRTDDPALLCLMHLWETVPQVQASFLDDAGSPYRRLIDNAFANFTAWYERHRQGSATLCLRPDDCVAGLLPGDFSVTLEKEGGAVRLGILGLNSAYLQLTDGDLTGRLAVHARQFHRACSVDGPEWAREHDACLLLTHHPVDWLTEEAQRHLNGEIHAPPELFALHLFGHMHENRLTYVAKGGGQERRRLQGCSLFGLESWGTNAGERRHGYSLGQLRIKGNKAKLRIFPRRAERQQDGSWRFSRDGDFIWSNGETATSWAPVTLLRRRRGLASRRRPEVGSSPWVPSTPDDVPLNNISATLGGVPEEPAGRNQELGELARLLRDEGESRLITLYGETGVGKSTLAIFLLAKMLKAKELNVFKAGVFRVDLKEVGGRDGVDGYTNWDLVVNRISTATPFADSTGDTLVDSVRVVKSIGEQNVLLLLDNFEHALSGASFVATLLSSCPGLRIVATSQEFLQAGAADLARWEKTFRVLPLPVPEPGDMTDLDRLRQVPSVALFIRRGQTVQEDFDLDPGHAEAIVDICRMLDGLPLAIEMAAGALKAFNPTYIRDTLAKFGLEGMPRSEMLDRALEWRYGSLPDLEKELFRRISVFSGGFSQDAAEEVLQRSRVDWPLVPTLTGLLKRHLVRLEGARYQMLWVLQEYGLKRLQEHPDESAVTRREHAAYFARVGEEAGLELTSTRRKELMERLDAEYGNLRMVFKWSLGPGGSLDVGARLAGRLFWYWNLRGRFDQGRQQLRAFLDRLGASGDPEIRARLLYGDGGLAYLQGDYRLARQQLTESVRLFREAGDLRGLWYALPVLAVVRREMDEVLDGARRCVEESVAGFRESGDHWGYALALNDLGNVAVTQRQYGEGKLHYTEAVRLWQEMGEPWGLSLSLGNLGRLAYLEREYLAAGEYFRRAREIQAAEGDSWGVAWSLKGMGDVAAAREEIAWAAKYYGDSFTLHWRLGRKQLLAECLDGLAGVALRRKELGRAAEFLGAAEKLRDGWKPEYLREAHGSIVAAVRDALGEAEFGRGHEAGRSWRSDEMLEHVTRSVRLWSEQAGSVGRSGGS